MKKAMDSFDEQNLAQHAEICDEQIYITEHGQTTGHVLAKINGTYIGWERGAGAVSDTGDTDVRCTDIR